MSEETRGSASASQSLPDAANLDWLRKQAKRRLRELRQSNSEAKLADAQFELAKQYGFSSWRALKSHVDSLTLDGQLFDAAKGGDAERLATLLDAHPDRLYVGKEPYGWTLLHVAAHSGRLAAVNLLLQRGLDPNTREKGDDTYAMHWAAAAGHLDIVRRLADAGGDVIGRGDDHGLELIGWASGWDGSDDAAHRAIVDFLISRGARHHIFSAIAMNLADEVRRIVAKDPAAINNRMTRSDDHRTPLHFAVLRNRPEMVALLIDLGADPLAVDGSGESAVTYATMPRTDLRLMEKIRDMTASELLSAERGNRPARGGWMDLVAALALGDREMATRLVRDNPALLGGAGTAGGALHLMAKRGDIEAVRWLLAHGADPNARWMHWDAEVTPLHLAALANHADIVPLLLAAGADPRIKDSKHDSDAKGWAEFFDRREIVQMLSASAKT